MNPAKDSGECRFASLKEGRNIFQITIKRISTKSIRICMYVFECFEHSFDQILMGFPGGSEGKESACNA